MSDDVRLHRLVDAVTDELARANRTVKDVEVARVIVAQHRDVFETHAFNGFKRQVHKIMTRDEPGSGLPRMVSVDNRGTLVQRTLMDPDEYQMATSRYITQSNQSMSKAIALADECERIHGIRPSLRTDVPEPV